MALPATSAESAACERLDPHALCVAPMLRCTDRHARYFLRLISPHSVLYTEMITSAALLQGDCSRLLAHDPREHPVAAQIAGSDPGALARAARLVEQAGFAEVNLNCGCPSDRVQAGRFGACLMAEPALVAECVAAMRDAVTIPVTVKTRIGIDHQDAYADLHRFAAAVADAGCAMLAVHARKAWLKGLSPRENRTVPPLRYDFVHRLKRDFPELPIVINGGIERIDQVQAQLQHVDGVMLGRAAYHAPWLLARVDRALFGTNPATPGTPRAAVLALTPYVHAHIAAGGHLSEISRHLLGLFQGYPGARAWRRHLSEQGVRPGAGHGVLEEALALVAGRGAIAARAEPEDAPEIGRPAR